MLENFAKVIELINKLFTPPFSLLLCSLVFRKSLGNLLIATSGAMTRISSIKGIDFSTMPQNMLEPDPQIRKADKKEIEKQLAFERIYRVIYGSQISLLNQLNTVNYLEKEFVESFFLKAKQYYAESYKQITFDKWLEFILKKELCIIDSTNYYLTPLGKEFLIYMVQNGMQEQKIL